MVTGNIYINGNSIHAMFDSGASHSFISESCAGKLHMVPEQLPYDICVSTPMGANVVTGVACLNCVVEYEHLSNVI